jgi:hypothetical protein
MTTELVAPLDGRETGRFMRDKRGRLTFVCGDTWRETDSCVNNSEHYRQLR